MEEKTERDREKELDELLARYRLEHKRVIGWLDDDYGPLVFRLACALHPPREAMRGILDDLPALGMQVSAELQKLAQATGKVRGLARG